MLPSRLAVMNMVGSTPEYAYIVRQKLLDGKAWSPRGGKAQDNEEVHERCLASGFPAFEGIRRPSPALRGASIIRELAFVSAPGGKNPSARVEDIFVTTT